MSVTLPNIPPYYVAPRLEYSMAQKLQIAMQTNLMWLDRAYHIARVGVNAEGKTTYPQIHSNDGTKEHFDIRPDNNLASYCFFEIDKPGEIDIYNDRIDFSFSIVFWCNLDLIDTSKNYDFTGELIKEVTDLLNFYEADNFVYDTRPERIFDKYNGLTQELKQYLMQRYSGFKVSFKIKDSYTDNCNPEEISVCQMNIDRYNNSPQSLKDCLSLAFFGNINIITAQSSIITS